MKTIWKYPIKTTGSQEIHIPEGGLILNVQIQNNIPCLWVLVDPNGYLETRIIQVVGTGSEFSYNESDRYIGTYQELNEALVWHVFE